MHCETFPNREQTELKILERPNNEDINLTCYFFADQKLVISCSVRHFRIEIRQNLESLNLLVMQVSVQLVTIISVNAELWQGLPRSGDGLW